MALAVRPGPGRALRFEPHPAPAKAVAPSRTRMACRRITFLMRGWNLDALSDALLTRRQVRPLRRGMADAPPERESEPAPPVSGSGECSAELLQFRLVDRVHVLGSR